MSNLYTDDEARLLVQNDGLDLAKLSSAQRNNITIVLTAVTERGVALQYASPELKNNKDVVLAAVTQHGVALRYASTNLQDNNEIVLSALKHCGLVLEYASSRLRDNMDIVRASIENGIGAFSFASLRLRSDKKFMLEMVTQDGYLLNGASPELQNDLELVLTAIYGDTFNELQLEDICSQKLMSDPRILFIYANKELIGLVDWPLIKRALLERPDYFLNPEPAIKALTDGMTYPYLILAQYALSKDAIIEPNTYPEITF